ncbi:hypothetical protein QP293_26090, partial [Escherichia coli]|nr:hypothetical protein [Escherichia coli]
RCYCLKLRWLPRTPFRRFGRCPLPPPHRDPAFKLKPHSRIKGGSAADADPRVRCEQGVMHILSGCAMVSFIERPS